MNQNPIVKLAEVIQSKQPAAVATVIEVDGASPGKGKRAAREDRRGYFTTGRGGEPVLSVAKERFVRRFYAG